MFLVDVGFDPVRMRRSRLALRCTSPLLTVLPKLTPNKEASYFGGISVDDVHRNTRRRRNIRMGSNFESHVRHEQTHELYPRYDCKDESRPPPPAAEGKYIIHRKIKKQLFCYTSYKTGKRFNISLFRMKH